MNVTIVGLGKIGVPLAVQFASKGATVTGYDTNAARVAEINEKRNPLPSEPGLNEKIPGLVASGGLRATADAREAVADADVVVLIVPVDIDAANRPDFTLLDSAVGAIAPHLKRGVLIIVETTVPVGTTRYRVGAQVAGASGLAATDFLLAFSPERVSSGQVLRDLRTYPKIVGGVDAQSTARAVEFYAAHLDAEIRPVRDAETAEFSKLAETTYRDVNIALANEFARIADQVGVDALEAIAAANSQPYSHVHAPGPGVGGHCIPVYPYFLAAPETPGAGALDTDLVAAAREINDGMAEYAVARLGAALGSLEGETVVVLGLAYRAGVKESRHSSAVGLAAALRAAGAVTYVHDPLYSADEIRAHGLEPPPSWPLWCDALVVQAWHEEYAALDLRAFAGLRAVLDARAALDPEAVTALGIAYVGIGRSQGLGSGEEPEKSIPRLTDGSPDPAWALGHVRAFVAGEATAAVYCQPLDELMRWTDTVGDANEIAGVDEDRLLMHAFAYGLAATCLSLGSDLTTLDEARADAAEWMPHLGAGQLAWERLVRSGVEPFPAADDS